jgi:hypothetical protein
MRMRSLIAVGVALATVGFAAGAADAFTLTGGPLLSSGGSLRCQWVNITGKPLDLDDTSIEFFAANGDPIPEGQTCAGASVSAVRSCASTTVDASARYCIVTISGIGRAAIRATLMRLDTDGVPTAVVPLE